MQTPYADAQNLSVSLGYYNEPLHIRVAKSVIGNSAGGNAYLFSPVGYDVNYIVSTFLANLATGNFTTSSLRTQDLGIGQNLSSATVDGIAGENASGSIASTDSGESDTINRLSYSQNQGSQNSISIPQISYFNQLPKLGNKTDVYDVPAGTDLHLDSLTLSGNMTIIMESGSVYVNGNVINNPTSSWAFVVKKGNVVIGNNVTDIAGVFVTLSGSILSDGVSTPTQLRVDGNLYGSSADLVNNRTYVR